MATNTKKAPVLSFMLVIAALILSICGDVAEDKKECQGRLVSELSSCFTFVSGQVKYPIPTCCEKLNKNYDINTRTCLCVAVRDRSDPKLGFNINTTLALSLPYICHVSTANVSECPDLLHMDRNSSDAQVFLQFNSTSAVNDITASSNGAAKKSLGVVGTIGSIFMLMMFSLIFHQI